MSVMVHRTLLRPMSARPVSLEKHDIRTRSVASVERFIVYEKLVEALYRKKIEGHARMKRRFAIETPTMLTGRINDEVSIQSVIGA